MDSSDTIRIQSHQNANLETTPLFEPLAEESLSQETLEQLEYEQLLTKIGCSTYQYKIILKCGLSNAADSIEIVAVGFVISGNNDLNMNSFDKGLLTSIIFGW